jgi:transcriptional regulator with XRE-family HTH domain
MSQAQWARELGVQPSFLSMVLCGQRRPSIDLALEMARSSGLPVELVAQLRASSAVQEEAQA